MRGGLETRPGATRPAASGTSDREIPARTRPVLAWGSVARTWVLAAVVSVAAGAASVSTAGAPHPGPLAVSTGVESLETGGDPSAPIDSVWVAELLHRHRVPGASVAVVDGGEIVWAAGYGLADAASGVAADTGTLFQAASISKPVTAVGALRLVQLGFIELDEDVAPRLRSWSLPESAWAEQEKVTLRRLLSHSAGTTVHGFRGYAAGEMIPSLEQVLDGVPPANSPPVRVEATPGSRWRYSGGGTSIVQQLIVDLAVESFPEHMRRHVLSPLGMSNSTFEQPSDRSLVRAASGHDGSGAVIRGRWHTYPENAAAGLWTTPSDLARLVIGVHRSLDGSRAGILSAELTREMVSVQHGTHGLGFEITNCGGAICFSHAGANAGFRALLIGVAATGQGAVVMTNGDGGIPVAQAIVRQIATSNGWPGASR